jgi:hypothetical protein
MSQNPLAIFYAQFDGLPLPTTPLIDNEVYFIAVCLGYPLTFPVFTRAIEEVQKQPMAIFVIRQSLVEIIRLEDLKIKAVGLRRVTQVEDIKLNGNYTDSILNDLAIEVKRIASIMLLPVLDNLYTSTDNVEGTINWATQNVDRYRSSYGIGGYSTR